MKICSINGCNGKHLAKGYCVRHYKQMKRHGRVFNTRYETNEYVDVGDYLEIILKNIKGEESGRTLIDSSQRSLVDEYRFGYKDGYTTISKNDYREYLHRYLLDAKQGEYVDHINRNKLDNRISNLRICTNQQNAMNIDVARSNSNFKGVSYCKTNKKWRAYITIDGIFNSLGYYKSKEEAILSRIEADLHYFKEFSIFDDGKYSLKNK